MNAFGDCGLRAMPTLFCGHMSGVNWLPRWSLDSQTPHGRFRTIAGGNVSQFGIGDFYADPRLLDAQLTFARAAGACVRDHPALFAWDLGNEFSNLREPKTPEDAAQWSLRLTERAARSVGRRRHRRHARRRFGTRPPHSPIEHRASVGVCDDARLLGLQRVFARTPRHQRRAVSLAAAGIVAAENRVLFSEFGNPTCPPGTVSPYDRVPLPGDPLQQNAARPAECRALRVFERRRNGAVCLRRHRPSARARRARRILVVLGRLRSRARVACRRSIWRRTS